MCFSAAVSYATAAALVPAGLYAFARARGPKRAYRALALAPLLFGIQQAFEGRVWQLVEAGTAASAVPFALGFHFFSHFLWLWWIPLASALAEPGRLRRRIFFGVSAVGFVAGAVVYLTLLLNPAWMSVTTRGHSIVYDINPAGGNPVDLGIPASVPYALIILMPLLLSSDSGVRRFGLLVALSATLASALWGYAFVSVWCFFAALLSLYIIFMVRPPAPAANGS